jgi:hypothetical protein
LFPEPDCKDGYCVAIYKPYLRFADEDNANAVGEEVLYMAIDSLLYFSLIMLIEFGVFGILHEKVKKALLGNRVERQLLDDDDVKREEDRVDGQVKGIFTTLIIMKKGLKLCFTVLYILKSKQRFVLPQF